MSAITIRLDWPPRELSPNFRAKHWSIPARAKREYRKACWADARKAKDFSTTYPLTGPLEAHVTFLTNTEQRMDLDNLIASLKAGLDGVADAGVIDNDKDIVSWSSEVVKCLRREVLLFIKERPL